MDPTEFVSSTLLTENGSGSSFEMSYSLECQTIGEAQKLFNSLFTMLVSWKIIF
jgi:hypothetical protein